ncbi:YrdB family protein [Streptomyces beihaiensis]|uniref:YrdB family protein n=1 Tax=Streptomyces beihaiensis TaxID=2984495 RepID=A0ABT3TV73_9ACTN|nr:YrdB family protein [Streptomyces beihaiensis]MCX3060933.1 YrdB family protein [Streptomyces beihaiensis]
MTTGIGYNPAMLALRFVLELTALVCFGYWAWHVTPGWARYLTVIAAPALVAVVWGTFATPGDASRNGETVVATAGGIRLLIELAVFFGGAAVLYAAGAHAQALVLAAILVAYHSASLDRIAWLLRH